MNRIERLTGIVMALQARPMTAQHLADRFEVSRRTILRDIDALSQLRVPIIAISGPNGGYRLPDDFSLPPVHLTSEEATLTLLALAALTPESGSTMARTHASARDKILAAIRHDIRAEALANLDHVAVTDGTEAIDETLMATLRRACADGTWLRMSYAGGNRSGERLVLPQEIYLARQRWYLLAIDHNRRATRNFRLSRIITVHEATPPLDASTLLAEVASSATDYHHPRHPEVLLSLTGRGVQFIRDHPDLRHHLDGKTVRFRCPESELAFYAREIIRFGTEIRVIAPRALQLLIQEMLAELAMHHGTTGNQ